MGTLKYYTAAACQHARALVYPKDLKTRAKINEMLFFDEGSVFPAVRGVIFPTALLGEENVPQEAHDRLEEVAGILDNKLKEKSYLVGDSKTIADFCIYAMLNIAKMFDYDLSKFSSLCSWYDNVKSQLSYDDEINVKPIQMFKEATTLARAERQKSVQKKVYCRTALQP